MPDAATSTATPIPESRDLVVALVERISTERDGYKKLYRETLELCRKLERGLLGQKREKLSAGDAQITMSLLGMLLGGGATPDAAVEPIPVPVDEVRAHTRQKPTGRKPLPEELPRVDLEVVPPDVQRAGLDAFERIGEDVTETVEWRRASVVVVRMHKPKFVPKGRDRAAETKVLQAPSPELPIERGLAGPGLLAETLVWRWQDHLPLHRMERIFARQGLPLARSTICGWHAELADLVRPLIEAMWQDALTAPYLCTDATGVLVQAKEKCRHGHFFVVAAPERHVLFAYTPKHDGAAVKDLLGDYKGTLVADAHAVYNHLYKSGDVIEAGCWAHARRYWFKALAVDPERARQALALIGALFRLERAHATSPPDQRLAVRKREAAPIVEKYFAWCDAEADHALDETPSAKAIGYARNQRAALSRFLEDGRLPIHNNFSERELRREAIGRKNWIFLGSDDGGEVNATFVSLLASCQLHEIEPSAYLRDLLCLIPSWPARRVLELAPAYWQQTLQQQDTQQRLAANVFRQVALGELDEHSAKK
ncbi:MAG TPA: IS66 family transposase [Anaeromyxobacteraceae bacterium]